MHSKRSVKRSSSGSKIAELSPKPVISSSGSPLPWRS
jgi:hypothetical protein